MSVLLPSDLAFALADTTRLRVLVLLHRARRELCVCELTAALDLVQPKMSRHLKALRDAQILRAQRSGQWVYYRLNPALPLWAVEVLRGFADGAESQAPYRDDLARLKTACGATGCR
ncbi:MAG: metalloregulator ArsR/SmtB family transcription factor [Gammaproteobacteria bacterium]|nr:metalloregulator ArsR/SmtB family transcription factor [Gammaproteobacteria bacterium]MCP5137686.1 metalloregulator ArsR/SmtB family transcription factor [Gammaproteobacteria bacterium]